MRNYIDILRELISLIPDAAYVAIDTEFFHGLEVCIPSFITPEAFYQLYVEHHRDQYVAQFGITVSLPNASSIEEGSPTEFTDSEVHAMNQACEAYGIPRVFGLDFKRFSFNTKVNAVTKFSTATLEFLQSSGFSMDTWIATAVNISTHPRTIVDRCVEFWSQLFAMLDAIHGVHGFCDAEGVFPTLFARLNPRLDASTHEVVPSFGKRVAQDAYGISNHFLIPALNSLDTTKGSSSQMHLIYAEGCLYEMSVKVKYSDIFSYLGIFLTELQCEDTNFNSAKALEYYVTVTPDGGYPHAVIPDYLLLLEEDIWALTNGSVPDLKERLQAESDYFRSPTKNPSIQLTVRIWRTREEAQLHTHNFLQRLKTELYGMRALFDSIRKYNVPLVIYAGYADVYLTLASVYGTYYLSTYKQFRTLVSNTLPRIFDLKIFLDLPPIINHLKTNLSLTSRSLSQVFAITPYSLQSFSGEETHDSAHDAGYDSLMTALAFEWIMAHFLAITGAVTLTSRRMLTYKVQGCKINKDLPKNRLSSFLNYTWNKLYVHQSGFPYALEDGPTAVSGINTTKDTLTQYILYPVRSMQNILKALSKLSTHLKKFYPNEDYHYFVDRHIRCGRMYIPTSHPGANEVYSGIVAAESEGASYQFVDPSIAEIHTIQYVQGAYPSA